MVDTLEFQGLYIDAISLLSGISVHTEYTFVKFGVFSYQDILRNFGLRFHNKRVVKKELIQLKISKLTSNKNSYVLFKSLQFDIEYPFSSPANYLNHNETYGWLLFHTPSFSSTCVQAL